MSVPQQLVIDRMRRRCEELDERYPGYRVDLIRCLAEILTLERAGDHSVAKQVEAQLSALGDVYHRRTSEEGDA